MAAARSISVSLPVDVMVPFDVVAAAVNDDDPAGDEVVDSVVTVIAEFDNSG